MKNIDIKKILFIQRQIESGNLDKKSVSDLIKDLDADEKEAIKELYKLQIQGLETNFQNYKRKITYIRHKLGIKKEAI